MLRYHLLSAYYMPGFFQMFSVKHVIQLKHAILTTIYVVDKI